MIPKRNDENGTQSGGAAGISRGLTGCDQSWRTGARRGRPGLPSHHCLLTHLLSWHLHLVSCISQWLSLAFIKYFLGTWGFPPWLTFFRILNHPGNHVLLGMCWESKIKSVHIFPFHFCGNSFYFCFQFHAFPREKGVRMNFTPWSWWVIAISGQPYSAKDLGLFM